MDAIYDKDGNVLQVVDVVYGFIKAMASEASKDIDDVYIAVYEYNDTWIEMYEARDNGYDGLDLCEVGKSIKVNNR